MIHSVACLGILSFVSRISKVCAHERALSLVWIAFVSLLGGAKCRFHFSLPFCLWIYCCNGTTRRAVVVSIILFRRESGSAHTRPICIQTKRRRKKWNLSGSSGRREKKGSQRCAASSSRVLITLGQVFDSLISAPRTARAARPASNMFIYAPYAPLFYWNTFESLNKTKNYFFFLFFIFILKVSSSRAHQLSPLFRCIHKTRLVLSSFRGRSNSSRLAIRALKQFL